MSDTATDAPADTAADTTPAPAPAAAAPAPAAAAPAAAPAVADKVEPAKQQAAAPAKGDKPAAKDAADTPANWPANWREMVSKEDAKVLTRLQRYASPEAALEALIAAQNRISAGELKPVLAKNATPEQIKEWREANGVPESADKYDLGDAGKAVPKELLDVVLAEAHATNQTPEQIKGTLKAWGKIQQDIAALRAENDHTAKVNGEEELRAEWGADFRRHINLIHGVLDAHAPAGFKDQLMQARLADGTLLSSSTPFLRFMAQMALIDNPAGIVVPSGSGNPAQSVESEIAKIEEKIGTKEYTRDEKMQARYRELLTMRDQLKKRA